MLHQMENWAWRTPDNVSDGDEFVMCNFVQWTPDTDIFAGKTGLKFLQCNLINCRLPADASVNLCNTAENEYVIEPEEPEE